MTTSRHIALASALTLLGFDAISVWGCWAVPRPWFCPCLLALMSLNRICSALNRRVQES